MACAACGPRCGTAVSARKTASRPGCCSGHEISSCAVVCVGAPMPWLCRNRSCTSATSRTSQAEASMDSCIQQRDSIAVAKQQHGKITLFMK